MPLLETIAMISGEQFQQLAEISFCSDTNCIIDAQNKHLKQNIVKIKDFTPTDIKKYKVIFVYSHDIDIFINTLFDYLNDDTIIITHNSDNGIDTKYKTFLDSKKIKTWFCQNRYIEHPKLFSIPIGLANSQWPHGNQNLITEIRNKNNKKEFLVYKNFDINTNLHERNICNTITSNNGIPLALPKPIAEYWELMSKSVFIVSPPGNGIDCHRIWEALYLRCVPIVKYHETFSQFKHLPILFVNSWEEVTVDLLKDKVKMFTEESFNIPELELIFWKEKICMV